VPALGAVDREEETGTEDDRLGSVIVTRTVGGGRTGETEGDDSTEEEEESAIAAAAISDSIRLRASASVAARCCFSNSRRMEV
jgi:hypothetical protein